MAPPVCSQNGRVCTRTAATFSGTLLKLVAAVEASLTQKGCASPAKTGPYARRPLTPFLGEK
jgi:hypothetical protein